MARGMHHPQAALAHLYPAAGQKRRALREYLPELVVLLACLITVASLWVVVIRHAGNERTRLEFQMMGRGSDLAIALSEEVGHTLNEAGQAATFVAYNYLHRRSPLDLSYWPKIHAPDVFPAVSVLNAEGLVVASDLDEDLFDYAAQRFFKQQVHASGEAMLIGDPTADWDLGRRRIPVSWRMEQADGRFAGLVVVWLNPESFGSAYREASLHAHDAMAIVSPHAEVLMHFGDAADPLGGSVSILNAVHNAARASAEFIQPAGQGANARAQIVAYRALTGYPLYAVVSLDYDGALGAFYDRRTTYYAVAAAVSAVIMLLTAALLFMLGKQRKTAAKLQQTLANEALHDALTGLANRPLLHDHCARAINRARRHEQCLVLLYLDLDNFKSINDKHGHAVGDLVLQEVAARLLTCVRATSEDLVARLGGDEFCIVLSNVDRAQGEAIGQKILRVIATPIEWVSLHFDLTASLGAAFFSDATDNVEALIDLADRGMYEAKRAGKNQFRWGRLDDS